MITEISTTITTDGSGAATVHLGSKIRGKVHAIKYSPGTIATGADLTITGEITGVPILTVTNAGTSEVWWHPRALATQNTDASAATDAFVDIEVVLERIQVVVAQGGASATGTITAYINHPDPF